MRIIVYGSLRRKQGDSHWMTNGLLLGDFQLEGYDLYNLGHHSGVIPGDGKVYCEVYRVDASTLGELDAIRTAGDEYKRELIQTPYGSAWLYVYQRSVSGRTRILSGDWLLRDTDE